MPQHEEDFQEVIRALVEAEIDTQLQAQVEKLAQEAAETGKVASLEEHLESLRNQEPPQN